MVNDSFKAKEALYQRVGAMVMDGLVAAVAAACPEGGTLAQLLAGNLLGHLQFAAALPDAVRFLFGLLYGPEEGRPGFDMTGYAVVEARIRHAFDRAIRSGGFELHAGVTRADADELYHGLVMSVIMHDAKALAFGKPRTVASRRDGSRSCSPGSARCMSSSRRNARGASGGGVAEQIGRRTHGFRSRCADRSLAVSAP